MRNTATCSWNELTTLIGETNNKNVTNTSPPTFQIVVSALGWRVMGSSDEGRPLWGETSGLRPDDEKGRKLCQDLGWKIPGRRNTLDILGVKYRTAFVMNKRIRSWGQHCPNVFQGTLDVGHCPQYSLPPFKRIPLSKINFLLEIPSGVSQLCIKDSESTTIKNFNLVYTFLQPWPMISFSLDTLLHLHGQGDAGLKVMKLCSSPFDVIPTSNLHSQGPQWSWQPVWCVWGRIQEPIRFMAAWWRRPLDILLPHLTFFSF